jgi:N6-L-threonylcarbamoyladenine synthase
MIVLGIETSCDETAAALVEDSRAIRADLIYSQIDAHRIFGGVVPEIAARAHLDKLDELIRAALRQAQIDWRELAGVAATAGPGLIGGLHVGVATAKAIAAVHAIPFLAINHLEAHALSARLIAPVEFPFLLLLVSGGHCQLVAAEAVGRYVELGSTLDDAVGECFDKVAKLVGLPYPGGPAIERAAASGDPKRYDLPRPMLGRERPDFSFSGLKTAVRHLVEKLGPRAFEDRVRADLAASVQAAIAAVLADRTARAIELFRARWPAGRSLVLAGGVAANAAIRTRLGAVAAAAGFSLMVPPAGLCTDNGAMVAWAGIERLQLGLTSPLNFAPRPRWPLAELAYARSAA